MLAQDTGGAIRGAVRADFFWGFGDEAGREAGRMRQEGRMWMLWPKDAPLPQSQEIRRLGESWLKSASATATIGRRSRPDRQSAPANTPSAWRSA